MDSKALSTFAFAEDVLVLKSANDCPLQWTYNRIGIITVLERGFNLVSHMIMYIARPREGDHSTGRVR